MWNKLLILLLFALLPAAGFTQSPTVKADHPDSYTVVKGDTLWDIAGRFLEKPWRWPEIWEVNPQVENPHLIYPGDVISLVYRDGKPTLSVARSGARSRYVKLTPEIRSSPQDTAIPAIPIEVIRPFLSQQLVVSKDDMDGWPYIVASYDQHLIAGAGNKIYVRGLPDDHQTRYSVYRRGPAYVVPDDIDKARQERNLTTTGKYSDSLPQGEVLGYQALHVGEAVIERGGDPATAKLLSTEREVFIGDRLVPQSDSLGSGDYIPKIPEQEIDGYVISVIDGVASIGNYQIVVLSVGTNQGLENGSVVAIYQSGDVVRDKVIARQRAKEVGAPWLDYFGQIDSQPEYVELPSEFAGVVMVFRPFEEVSYGLVMRTERTIHLYDTVGNL